MAALLVISVLLFFAMRGMDESPNASLVGLLSFGFFVFWMISAVALY